MNFYIYILYSKSIDKYYVGFSNDPWKRLEHHLNNDPDKFTGKAKDWGTICYFLGFTRKQRGFKYR